MKYSKIAIIIILALVPILTAISCDHRPHNTPTNVATKLHLYYTIDDSAYDTIVTGDASLQYLVDDLLEYADQGHKIKLSTVDPVSRPMFLNQGSQVITFSTTDRQEARNWTSKMIKRGYTVTINKDRLSGTYHCSASK